MKKNKITFSVFFLLGSISILFAQYEKDVLLDLKVDVVYLASDLLQGRETGTEGESLAADYIIDRMKTIGLSPKGENGDWLQPFDFQFNLNPHAKGGENRTGKNVIGYLDNGATNTVVVGGHYDHLGQGEFGSLHAGEKDIHNGADDNASGIAAMLRIAAHLKNSTAKNNNYLFIAFSGEELGLYGSKHFVKHPTIDLKQINYVINMDMVGRLNEEKVLAINGVGTSPSFKDVLQKIKAGGIQPKLSESGVGPSDHTSFYLKDIPVLHFFSGQHSDYHKPQDDSHLVNYEGIYDISSFIIQLIEDFNAAGKLSFTKTKDNTDRKVSKMGVTLGVMPDYVNTEEGMRIDAVIEGRVGHKAGLKDGDIVVKIGDMEVKDIYDYMDGLAKFKPGDKTIIVVKREGKMVEKKVHFE